MGELKKGAKWFADKSLDLIGLDKKKPPEAPVIPLPDEELIEQERRMKDRRRLTGRQSTILSDGLG